MTNKVKNESKIHKILDGRNNKYNFFHLTQKLIYPILLVALPKLFYEGIQNSVTKITIFEELGPNIKEMFLKNKKTFSLETILLIGYNMVTQISPI